MKVKMMEGTSVRQHVLKIISHIHEAEINRAQIDKATQVGMILETLSPSFLQFKSKYFMNKLTYNLTQLLNELTTFEFLLEGKQQSEANIVEARF
ncbi:hypothetical protein UlMin_026690 [Ulmus minor]